MLEPPLLTPFNTKEQQPLLLPLLLQDVRDPYPISKAEPSHLAEETHFGRLYLPSESFGHYPNDW